MDTLFMEPFDIDERCLRIRTARQKMRMRYKDFDRELRQLDEERSSLRKKRNELGYEPLVPAVQKGWKRFFVLREDVALSPQAAFFAGILEKINTYAWSYRKDFKVKRRKFGRKTYVVSDQRLKRLYHWEFLRKQFTEAEQVYFDIIWEPDKHRQPTRRYIFREPWMFVLRVEPNMIDKIRIKDPVLDQRIDQIYQYIERCDLQGRINKATGGRNWRYYEEEREWERTPLRNRPVEHILDELKEWL